MLAMKGVYKLLSSTNKTERFSYKVSGQMRGDEFKRLGFRFTVII